MVDVVGIETGWNVDDLPVHRHLFLSHRPRCVGGVAGFADMPFVGAQPFIVVGVDNGELALGQWDASERIAVPNPAVEKYDRQ